MNGYRSIVLRLLLILVAGLLLVVGYQRDQALQDDINANQAETISQLEDVVADLEEVSTAQADTITDLETVSTAQADTITDLEAERIRSELEQCQAINTAQQSTRDLAHSFTATILDMLALSPHAAATVEQARVDLNADLAAAAAADRDCDGDGVLTPADYAAP